MSKNNTKRELTPAAIRRIKNITFMIIFGVLLLLSAFTVYLWQKSQAAVAMYIATQSCTKQGDFYVCPACGEQKLNIQHLHDAMYPEAAARRVVQKQPVATCLSRS